ncbi:adenine/guanine phosphoribosyltransferase, partial [Klebsiella pneumoniae]|nr:adenine/guanine phosphoribosyltransferase [Klebsiella pneumoniae]
MSAIDGNFVYQKTLSCGRIEVSSEETDYPLTDLFDIAERRNPKRAFLFV